MAGLIVTILGYFRCMSKLFEGRFFSKTSPLTQAAVTDSGGVTMVTTLIYSKRLKGVLLMNISGFVSKAACQAISDNLVSQVFDSRPYSSHKLQVSNLNKEVERCSKTTFSSLIKLLSFYSVILCGWVNSGSSISILLARSLNFVI